MNTQLLHDEFKKFVQHLQMSNYRFNPQTHVMGVSFRPHILGMDVIILNTEYNKISAKEAAVGFEEYERNCEKDRRNWTQHKADRSHMKRAPPTTPIPLLNKYDVLTNLEEECTLFNKRTSSDITVEHCVNEFVKIVGRQKIEKINLNKILEEHKQLVIKQLSSEKDEQKKITEVKKTLDNLLISVQVTSRRQHKLDTHLALSASKVINKELNSFSTTLQLDLSKVSDDVNPHTLALQLGTLGKNTMVNTEELRPMLSQVVMTLNKTSQFVNHMKKVYHEAFKKLTNKTACYLLDLD